MRTVLAKTLLALTLALMLGLAWLTRNPQAEILSQATEWPLIGGWARSFREAYLPPPPPPPPPIDEEPEIIVIDRRGRVIDSDLPAPNPDRVLGARPRVWVAEHTPLLEEPAPGAPEMARTMGIANLRVFERRGDWFQVRYRSEDGWVHLEGYEESEEPPLGSDPLPPGPLPARLPDPERLGMVRDLLGEGAAVARVGGYQALSDRADPELVGFLDRLVRPLEEIYGERYGVAPVGEADGAIVLFAHHDDFAAYRDHEVGLGGLKVSGVAGGGIVAIDLEGRRREEIAATVVHEVTHLLNRRALGPALPAWLEEGLADDLAHSEVDPDGTLETARLGGVTIKRWDGWEWRGALASAIALRRALDRGRLRPLEELLILDWHDFMASEADQLNYAQASFWVRHMLDDPVLAAGFRGYLAGVAAGGSAEPDELRRHLREEWTSLDQGFARWIRIRFHEPL